MTTQTLRPLAPGTFPEVAEVTITRDKLYPEPGFQSFGPQWRWIYSVAIDGSQPVTHGTRLGDCERTVRAKYPNATITRNWPRRATVKGDPKVSVKAA